VSEILFRPVVFIYLNILFVVFNTREKVQLPYFIVRAEYDEVSHLITFDSCVDIMYVILIRISIIRISFIFSVFSHRYLTQFLFCSIADGEYKRRRKKSLVCLSCSLTEKNKNIILYYSLLSLYLCLTDRYK
jgi:hypothetical protein